MEQRELLRKAIHDIKNPLSTLVLQCELLTERMKETRDSDNERLARDIALEATRIAGLVDDLFHTSN